ncbi:MAG: hypothetical protein CME98_21685 [Hyphomonas sp.]|nr:hypothetical protein [Hyphomonas sp.]
MVVELVEHQIRKEELQEQIQFLVRLQAQVEEVVELFQVHQVVLQEEQEDQVVEAVVLIVQLQLQTEVKQEQVILHQSVHHKVIMVVLEV